MFFALAPTLEFDSWITIGIESAPVGEEVAVSVIEDGNQPFLGAFNATSSLAGSDILVDTQTGGAWYILNGTPNGLPDENGQVLVMQFTTGGSFSGTLNAQIFGNGIGENDIRKNILFDCAGTFYAEGDGGGTGGPDPVEGCMDSTACNYSADATEDDGSCFYADAGYDCDGVCLNDSDNDGICDEFEVSGCQDSTACNYSAAATDDDGSCTYADSGYDCDGVCLNDSYNDGICDEFETAGCQDSAACNYSASATDDDGSCEYADAGYDCDGVCLNDSDNDGICDEFEVAGCQDEAACNYSDAATNDDGSCDFCSCSEAAGLPSGYSMTVSEYATDGITGQTTYRVYFDLVNDDDFLSSI